MKVRYKGRTEFLILTHNKIYTVLGLERGWYRLVDDSGEDYLYSPENFEIVELIENVAELKDYLSNSTGRVMFDYNGFSCGIDPLALDSFDMWYGDKEITVKSADEVLTTEFFDGRSLKDIWDDITEISF